jgi:hypothetical protein
MPSQKLLSSVAHNIAHHAVSGLSYVHPHLKPALVEAGLSSISIDLLNPDFTPPQLKPNTPLAQALGGLKAKFVEILNAEGLALSDIQSAVLVFDFPSNYTDNYCSDCHVHLISATGKPYSQAVNYLGRSIAPNP